MNCNVCEDNGYRLVVHVVDEVVHASPVPCAGPGFLEAVGCPARAGISAERTKWEEWGTYVEAGMSLSGAARTKHLKAHEALRAWRGRFHDRQPAGTVVVGDAEAAWLTCHIRIAREEPRGAPVSDGDLPGFVAIGERCGWDPGKAVPDERRYRAELAESEGRRDAAEKVRELARGMVP